MKITAIVLLGLTLTACGGNSSNDEESAQTGMTGTGDTAGMDSMVDPGTARFRITFDATWNSTDFPTGFPGNPHFSPLVGAMHNEQVVFWQSDGQEASTGIESMAETGSTSLLIREIRSAMSNGYSEDALEGSGVGNGTGQTDIEFDAVAGFPLLTLVSMIAPSPDWFIGVGGFSLLDDDGQWKSAAEIPLKLYDAGTDLGASFNSSNNDNSADNLPITLLSTGRADSDFEGGVHFQSGKTVGRFIVERVDP